nr:hypothetical protein [Flavobacterium sp. ASV13]
MSSENNRIQNEVKEWMSKEDKLKSIFGKSPGIERSFGIEKLKFFRMLLFKYGKTKSLDELITVQFLKHECKSLRHKLYPNVFKRLFNDAVNSIAFERIHKPAYLKDLDANKKALEVQLKNTGFAQVWDKVLHQMKEEQLNFYIPVSYHISEKERLDHSLHFGKDVQGAYRFEGFTSTLHTDSIPSGRSTHHFKNEASEYFNVDEAYNMLAGRSVLKNGTWKQFNFYDKDLSENYRMHEFPQDYGYRVENVLALLPLKNTDGEAFYNLCSSLKEGKRQETVLLIEGREVKTFIETNPRFKTLNFYNDRMQKISLKELERGCKIQQVKKPEIYIEASSRKITPKF